MCGQDENEIEHTKGERQALAGMLAHCLRGLGYQSTEGQAAAWIVKRESAIAALRSVCSDHGDNDWDNDLHLADVIEKHLHRHLEGASDVALRSQRAIKKIIDQYIVPDHFTGEERERRVKAHMNMHLEN